MPTGLYGKLPAHGDFVRRALPDAFVEPWDAWLQQGIGAARDALGDAFADAWATAPAWRFRLPAGACGTAGAAGVLLASEDMVGRRFPLTVAALLPPGEPAPSASWYDVVEDAARAGRDSGAQADALLAGLPAEPWADADAPEPGWWMAQGGRWDLPGLPPPAQFRVLLEGGA
ncbi:type VI secretion system-associated protein TagF [Falsiroseomonas sp. CW058]|uniref:type VI secretion system-associated protein TagF n=1 Tax=Falsiroseomonas sp. CW058 TaxID=3388664 RepID=UPI003D31EE62